MFIDRAQAGKQLAAKLEHYRAKDAVVLALPRGGVAVGYEVARTLRLPIDIVVARKVGHPQNPEYALCAVDESGVRLCNEAEVLLVDPAWLAKETERQRKEAARRSYVYRQGGEPLELRGKIAIIVDDGIATGLTMRLAVASVRAKQPKQIVVAAPVAPSEAAEQLKREADEVVILESPEDFLGSVGAHYEQFAPVEDDEVVALLRAGMPRSTG